MADNGWVPICSRYMRLHRGYRVSLRSGMLGRSMLQNAGLNKQERAVLRDRFWAEVFGCRGGLDRWLIFGGAVCCVGAVVALNALVGQG